VNISRDIIPKLDSSTYKKALIKLSAALRYNKDVGGTLCAPRLVAPQFKSTEDGLRNFVMYDRVSHASDKK